MDKGVICVCELILVKLENLCLEIVLCSLHVQVGRGDGHGR